MSVYVLAPNESWICDRLVNEWYVGNADISTKRINDASTVWLYAEWCWKNVPLDFLLHRKVLVTIHHIVPSKFAESQVREFKERDRLVTAYHVPNEHTFNDVSNLTKKPVHIVPYWANDAAWIRFPSSYRNQLRMRHGVPIDAYVVGSFQRDTEGASIATGGFAPKLEKGPDLFVEFVRSTAIERSNVHVLLAGWRRQYVIHELRRIGTQFTYIELPSRQTLNELYQVLDLYPVTSRYEGGPQALIEAGLLGVPVVSRNVGMASVVLPPSAVNDDLMAAVSAVPNVETMRLPNGFEPYRRLLESL